MGAAGGAGAASPVLAIPDVPLPPTIGSIDARTNIRSLARLGWTAALVGLAVLVLAASASAKGPPSGKGGPPPWAGGASKGGPPTSAARGKDKGASAPAAKAKGAAKNAEKAVEKAARKTARASEKAEQNPAMRCFALIGELGEEFYETYGTNPNNANAFGKCVSEHAREQGGDGDDEPDEDAAEEPADCEEPAEGEEQADGDEPADDPLAALASFDEEIPAEEPCEPGEGETGDTEDGDGDGDGENESETEPEADGEVELTCFLPAAARANPFALCARA